MEINRLKNKQLATLFKPLYTKQYVQVKNAFEKGDLKEDTELIVFNVGSKHLAFSKHKMSFHHIAQGYVNEQPYMLTFCVICNSGMIMNPVVNGKMLHFYIAGAYNGMLFMADKETNSYWDHITGECVSGKHKGKQLKILQSHQILTAKEVLEQYSDCLYGQEKINFLQRLFASFATKKGNVRGKGFLPPNFRASMQKIDDRLPEMEMGLGLWKGKTAKFYPTKVIKENGNYLFDQWDNKNLIVYISPTTHTPSAMQIEKIDSAAFDGDKLILSDGKYIQSGNLYSSEEVKIDTNQPNQVFLRWYGFVSTFPNIEIKIMSKITT